MNIIESSSEVDANSLIHKYLNESAHGWAIGTFGAIGEYVRDLNEKYDVSTDFNGLATATSRGGIRINNDLGQVKIVPYETLSPRANNWAHGIAFCTADSELNHLSQPNLEELGLDHEAIREEDRNSTLFDMGVAAPFIRACIRVKRKETVLALREYIGKDLLSNARDAMTTILKENPHRVFISKLGRIEVFQPIPGPNDSSPEGPHTHVLPKLIKTGRTHAATTPIPNGYIPCLSLFPSHPLMDSLGQERPFIAKAYNEFQQVLMQYGDPEYIHEKNRIVDAVCKGENPASFLIPNQKFLRAGARIALRQLTHTNPDTEGLALWQQHFDHGLATSLEDH